MHRRCIIPMGRTDGHIAWFLLGFDKRRKKAGRGDPTVSYAWRIYAHTTLRPGFVRRQSTFLALMWCIVHACWMCIVGMCVLEGMWCAKTFLVSKILYGVHFLARMYGWVIEAWFCVIYGLWVIWWVLCGGFYMGELRRLGVGLRVCWRCCVLLRILNPHCELRQTIVSHLSYLHIDRKYFLPD